MSHASAFPIAGATCLALLAGCATQTAISRAKLDVRKPSVGPDEVLVLPDVDVGRLWTLKRSRIHFNAASGSGRQSRQGCVSVAYVIERDGSTSGHQVLRAIPKTYAEPALRSYMKWRYEPTAENVERKPVFTYSILTFGPTYDRVFHEKLRQTCAVQSLVVEDMLRTEP